MRAAVLAGLTVLCLSTAVLADDHSVIVDDDVDFSTFKTFFVWDASLSLRQAELNSPVLVKMLNEAVRQALRAKGLTESADQPDLVVETSVKGVDFEMQQMGRLVQMDRDLSHLRLA